MDIGDEIRGVNKALQDYGISVILYAMEIEMLAVSFEDIADKLICIVWSSGCKVYAITNMALNLSSPNNG